MLIVVTRDYYILKIPGIRLENMIPTIDIKNFLSGIKMSYAFRDHRGNVYVFGDNRNRRLSPSKDKFLGELTHLPLNFPVAKISRNCTSFAMNVFLISPGGSFQNSSLEGEVFLRKLNGEMIHVIDVSYIQQNTQGHLIRADQYGNYGILTVLTNDGYLYIRPSPVDLAREGEQDDPYLMVKLEDLPFIKKLSHHAYGTVPVFYAIDENDQPVSFRVTDDGNGYQIQMCQVNPEVETRFKDIWTSNGKSYFLDVEGRVYRGEIEGLQINLNKIGGLPPIEKMAILRGRRAEVCLLDKSNRVLAITGYFRNQNGSIGTSNEVVVDDVYEILANDDSLFILLNNGRILQYKFSDYETFSGFGTQDVTDLFERVNITFDEDAPLSSNSTKSARY